MQHKNDYSIILSLSIASSPSFSYSSILQTIAVASPSSEVEALFVVKALFDNVCSYSEYDVLLLLRFVRIVRYSRVLLSEISFFSLPFFIAIFLTLSEIQESDAVVVELGL